MQGGEVERMQTSDNLDLQSACSALLHDLDTTTLRGDRYLSILEQWARTSTPLASQTELFDALSHILIHPLCTEKVAIHLSPILLELCVRAIDQVDSAEEVDNDPYLLPIYHTLARLLAADPSIFSIVESFLGNATFAKALRQQRNTQIDAFLLSTYRLLRAAPSYFSEGHFITTGKDFLALAKTSPRLNIGSRLFALRIFAGMEGLTEAAFERVQENSIGLPPLLDADRQLPDGAIVRILHSNKVVEEVDAWLAPVLEAERVKAIKRRIRQQCYILSATNEAVFPLSPSVVSIGGHLFLRQRPTGPSAKETYRETSNVKSHLHTFGSKLAARLPILLTGPEGCGKTSLLGYACSLLHPNAGQNRIVTLQLGDQSGIDAKSLIGSLVSSLKNPGSFEWSEGALTRAVRLGKWVVLEDIDKAGGEVLSIIKPLVEDMGRRKTIASRPLLDLGTRGKVKAARSFALFATRTTTRLKQGASVPKASYFGYEHWEEVMLPALEQTDILEIIKAKNSLLSSSQDQTVGRIVDTWANIAAVASSRSYNTASGNTQATGTVRVPSFHDLLKWCSRIEMTLERSGASSSNLARAPLSNQALQEEIAIDACDIFLGSVPPQCVQKAHYIRCWMLCLRYSSFRRQTAPTSVVSDTERTQKTMLDRYSTLVNLLATKVGVDAMAIWHGLAERRPELRVEISSGDGRKVLHIGRGQLRRSKTPSMAVQAPSNTFAMTGPAARLMERIAVCVSMCEPVLIVGETGTGKTTVVQQLASLTRRPLIALNLSQQTETSDLLGGFKPLDAKFPAMELHNEWVDLFQQTFSSRRNARYLQAERKALQLEKWSRLYSTWKESIRLAKDKLASDQGEDSLDVEIVAEHRATKSRKLTNGGDRQMQSPPRLSDSDAELSQRWNALQQKMENFALQYTGKQRHLVFSFVEGPLVKAIRTGAWVLLDEINLAAAETLDCLTGLLQSPDSSIVLTEKGELEPVPRHPNFRLFACMNPATDVGKKDLPLSLRSRFTELYAPSPDEEQEALVSIVEKYIGQECFGDRGMILDVARFYSQIRQLAQSHQLADGANQRPHYSIRTLSRALLFAKDICATYGLRRAVWEGLIMTFTLLLDDKSAVVARGLIDREILAKAKNAKSSLAFVPPRPPSSTSSYVQVGSFWLETGSLPLESVDEYVLTPSVQDKLVGLARAALTRRSPVLIQGPTSAGKTSAVAYLAKRTGHKFVRINNHEHTDIQEYIGSYASDAESGHLVFQEGLLVTALRQGHWIVLDELNLAPTDVLEALNRLLDDNRELLIPETGQIVKPHPHFMLFATQNPAGLYAGRKVLSRAFRNRFLEMHFQDVPQAELQTILTNRCRIAPSYAEKIVSVFRELQRRRQTSRVFDSKHSFVTLRDLFRWGDREVADYQQLAEIGYMLIGERARQREDSIVVKQVLEEVINVKINVDNMYDIFDPPTLAKRIGDKLASALLSTLQGTEIVWTTSMQRLVCLIASALRNCEPVLLVGETGSGKTSVCEVLAAVFQRELVTVNCHQSTDTADLIGGQRPLRNRSSLREAARQCGIASLLRHGIVVDQDADLERVESLLSKVQVSDAAAKVELIQALSQVRHSLSLFEWSNGPLVSAMQEGKHLLLDEISLADDSVLERLNSVLEPDRTLVLAEKSAREAQSLEIVADSNFQIVATMNPGGDYGKKELSPALRNRFTEIWVPAIHSRNDLQLIVNHQWQGKLKADADVQKWSDKMIDFLSFFAECIGGQNVSMVGLRDLIAWARFINVVSTDEGMSLEDAFVNGAFMTLIDGLALHPSVAGKSKQQLQLLTDKLSDMLYDIVGMSKENSQTLLRANLVETDSHFCVGAFSYPKGTQPESFLPTSASFNLHAVTPARNALRVLRAMQVTERAIMLEGSPGAGKTSLVVALARKCGYKLTRINLSDQTELSDLFGADLPIEGGNVGEFDWKDAAFLQAMQEGSWVLLDEMNLASQTVLEGLNSCLDHRGSVHIPELGRSFFKHPTFRVFAAQNPQHQGGGRKGLPKSFLNRFTKVYVEELQDQDFSGIIKTIYPSIDDETLSNMVKFNGQLQSPLQQSTLFSKAGQPWEFNLRDLLRWLGLMHARLGLNLGCLDPLEYLCSLYLLRFRTYSDRIKVARLYQSIFGIEPRMNERPWHFTSPKLVQLGHVILVRKQQQHSQIQTPLNHAIPKSQKAVLQALAECVKLAWPAILVGSSRVGKTTLVRHMAHLTNCELVELRLNGGTDAIDVVGGFQQVDIDADGMQLLDRLASIGRSITSNASFLTTRSTQEQEPIWTLLEVIRTQQARMEGLKSSSSSFSSSSSSLDWRSLLQVATCLRQNDCSGLADSQTLHDLLERLERLASGEEGSSGKFGWIDGPVLKAMRRGSWLLLDDANLCSSSVLDRLNSLLEPGGSLVLSERGVLDGGEVEVVEPHPDFRIFFTLDPRYGELSRAMRNRGLEIFVDRWTVEAEEVEDNEFPLDSYTLSNAVQRTKQLQNSDQSSRHKQAMLLALLAQGLPSSSLALARRLIDHHQWALIEPMMTNTMLLGFRSEFKERISTTAIDATFLAEMGMDVQLNHYIHRALPTESNSFSVRLQLLVKIGMFMAQLQENLVETVKNQPDEQMSVLQKSALFCRGQDVEGLAKEDRHLFSLVEKITIALENYLSSSTSRTEDDSMQACQALLDCCSFLASTWSSTSHNDYSVTKVIVEEIKTIWSSLSVGRQSMHSTSVSMQIDSVLGQIRPSTGLAMQSIWSAFLPSVLNGEAVDLAVRLSQLFAHGRSQVSHDVASSAVDIAAALWRDTGSCSDVERKELISLGRRTLAALEVQKRQHMEIESDNEHADLDCLLLSALVLAVQYPSMDELWDAKRMRTLVQLIKDSRVFPLDIAIMQEAFGSPRAQLESGHEDLSKSSLDWVRTTFRVVSTKEATMGNTQQLFRPVLLEEVMRRCSSTLRVTFAEQDEHSRSLRRLTAAISTALPAEGGTRCQNVTVLLLDSMRGLAGVYLAALRQMVASTAKLVDLDTILASTSSQARLHQLELIVSQDVLPPEGIAMAAALHSCLQMETMLVDIVREQDDGEVYRKVGQTAIRFGHHILESYVPNVAMDPLATSRTDAEYRSYRIERLQQEREAVLEVEAAITGNARNILTDAIDATLHTLRQGASDQVIPEGVMLQRKTDTDILHKLYSELITFSQQVFSRAKMEEILTAGAINAGRLLNLQSTICALLDRLNTVYASLWDLSRPLQHAFSIVLIGLGLLLHSSRRAERKNADAIIEELLSSLVTFPSSIARSKYSIQDIPIRFKPESHLGALAVPLLLTKVRGIAADWVHKGLSTVLIDRLKVTYQQLWHLWTLDEERTRQKKEEEQSMYKMKNLDMTEEDEARREEEEFLSLFPQIADVMDENFPAVVQINGSKNSRQKREPTFFSPSDICQLFHLHLNLFESQPLASGETFMAAQVEVSRMLMQASTSDLSESLDKQSASLQISLLSRSASAIHITDERDFYLDSNPAEADRLNAVLQRMLYRLDQLIRDWPEQEGVLLSIKDRCERILALDSASSVHQMLAALEGLLVHTEDWQIYASSRNTLQPERDLMTSLIIEWRRLELRGWKTLLIREDQRSQATVGDMWFSLFQMVVQIDYESEEEEKRGQVISLLDQYLRGSTLGQYSTRLKLIHSFALYLGLLRRNKPEQQSGSLRDSPMETTLLNIYRFFQQLEKTVLNKLSSGQKLIEKELNDYVKLASWKDTNVHALKTSAAKTHRKLHRCLRKYRDVLNQPVDPILAAFKESSRLEDVSHRTYSEDAGTAASLHTSIQRLEYQQSRLSWHIGDTVPSHLVKLAVTATSLQKMYEKDLCRELCSLSTCADLVALSDTITARSEELAKATPAIWKEENNRLVKNLETRKRKSWSDLLRELRRIGLTVSSIAGASALDLCRGSFVFAAPTLDAGNDMEEVQKADRLHFRLLSLLPTLRSTISSTTRNEDVHVSQLQRALSFIENGFLASLVERQRLSSSLSSLRWFRTVESRIDQLACDHGGLEGKASIGNTSSYLTVYTQGLEDLDFWTRLQSGVEEIQRSADSHAEISLSGRQGLATVLPRLETLLTSISNFVKDLIKVLDGMQECNSTLLSAAEITLLTGQPALRQLVVVTLQEAITDAPALRSMCIPMLEWLKGVRAAHALDVNVEETSCDEKDSFNVGMESDRLVSAILVIAQDLQKLTYASSDSLPRQDNEIGELADRAIVTERQRLTSIWNVLRVNEVKDQVLQIFALADQHSVQAKVVRTALARVSPFLQMYRGLVQDFVSGCASWYQALLELDSTVCRLVLALASSGFCKPRQPEEGQSGEAGSENDEQLEGGMGLGEGEGAQDVTDTLKDDEMMEELQTDKTQDDNKDGETAGEKNAREMDDDFDGDLGDIEEEEGDGDKDLGDEEEEQQDIEEGVGEVDPLDLNAVDEKTWSGENEEAKQEEGTDKSEKQTQGQQSEDDKGAESKNAEKEEGEENHEGAEGAGQRSEKEKEAERAKEGEEKKGKQTEDEHEAGRDVEEESNEGDELNEDEETASENDHVESSVEGLGRAIDQEAQQAEPLDLDEDLKMDEGQEGESDLDDDMEADMDNVSDVGDDGGKALEQQEDEPLSFDEREEVSKAEESDNENARSPDADAEEDEGDETEVPHGQGEEPREEEEGNQAEEEKDTAQQQVDAQQARTCQEQTSQPVQDDMPMEDAGMGGDAWQDATAQQQQTIQSSSGRQAKGAAPSSTPATKHDMDVQNVEPESAQAEETKQIDNDGSQGAGQRREEEGRQGLGSEEDDKQDSQHQRSLGDALKEFKRNLDAIEERLRNEAKEDGAGMQPSGNETDQVEHIEPDQDSEMQALGAVAHEEQALQSLDDVGIEEEPDSGAADDEARMQVDEEVKELEAQEQMRLDHAPDDEEGDAALNRKDRRGGLLTSDIRSEQQQLDFEKNITGEDDHDFDEEEPEEISIEEAIESQMDALFASTESEQRQEIAQELWRSYVGATAEYAFTLSEQLRLILAPTKATKLTGDFKTGKRLNMRKIIPFIASDYLKDKIWLRRNRAQKREYQVLLSIDDSKSMYESRNMLLAFKSLALVCSALDKLEVGQVGLLKFGRQSELLKGFDGQQTNLSQDETEGGKVLERLQFQQKGTDVSAMLDKSFDVLMEERRKNQSSTAGQLWQLQIIISDGICQDHGKLQALLRRASEERIMVVFVILDSLQQQQPQQTTTSGNTGRSSNSILTMNSVHYTTSANGRPQLHMARYLDTFPFEHFVVVQDVADLPDVLSTTLRQWAQKIAET